MKGKKKCVMEVRMLFCVRGLSEGCGPRVEGQL